MTDNFIKELSSKLFDCGYYFNIQTNDGQNALIKAAKMGHTEIFKLLLERRAAIHSQNDDGRTALMFASQTGIETLSLFSKSI